MVKLHVVLQTVGLAGFPVAAYLAFGGAGAVAIGSVSLIAAGVALEREHETDLNAVIDAIREYDRAH